MSGPGSRPVRNTGLCAGRVLLPLLAVALAGGCAGLRSDAHPVQVYLIRASGVPRMPAGAGRAASLTVVRPLARPGLESDHIVLVQTDHRMSYFVGSRWPADLPSLVESLAVDTLRSSGEWTTVQDSSSLFASDFILQITISRFEADYTTDPGKPQIHVELDCSVGHRSAREVDTAFRAAGDAVAAANRLGDVIAAFESAANQALHVIATRAPQVLGPEP